MNIQKNISLKKLNSWKTGGSAEFFCEPSSLQELLFSLKQAKNKNLPVSLLSGGTNVLISDKGIKGLTISFAKLNKLHSYIKEDRLRISAEAGVSKAKLMQVFLKHQLAPALFLCGLPGDVGGGVVMNAGIRQKNIAPREFGEIVDQITVVRNKQLVCIPKKNIIWKYRASAGWLQKDTTECNVIYEVNMSWPLKPVSDLSKKIRETALKRSQSQPLQSASCGSVFKNPSADISAGFLIDQCGLKKHCIGRACVSEKHANFIINLGGATARDIHQLILFIQKCVKEQKGILLEPEVKYLGQWT